jgi:hypothetical protein
MPVGIAVTKDAIDNLAGSLLRDVHRTLRRATDFRDFLQGMGNADLGALGYTNAEIQALKDAYADLQLLWNLYNGKDVLPAAKDFKTSAKVLWGINVP